MKLGYGELNSNQSNCAELHSISVPVPTLLTLKSNWYCSQKNVTGNPKYVREPWSHWPSSIQLLGAQVPRQSMTSLRSSRHSSGEAWLKVALSEW